MTRLARVAALEDLQRQPALLLERGLHLLRDHERVVRDEHDLLALAAVPGVTAPGRERRPRAPRARPRALSTDRHKDSFVSGAGRTASRQPRSTVMRASEAEKTFETPRLVPGGSVSSRSGYSSPSVVTPSAGAVHREQGEKVARGARERARAADDGDPRVAEIRIDLGRCVALVGEEEHRAEQVVEAATARADDDDSGWAERDRRVERELEIGRVLGRRVPLDPRACRLGCGEPCRGDGVEVADREVDVQPERERPVDAAVGGDHHRAGGERGHGASENVLRVPSGNDDDGLGLHAHTSAGITQIRFCGSVARRATLSARSCPSSPFRFGHPSARRRRACGSAPVDRARTESGRTHSASNRGEEEDDETQKRQCSRPSVTVVVAVRRGCGAGGPRRRRLHHRTAEDARRVSCRGSRSRRS